MEKPSQCACMLINSHQANLQPNHHHCIPSLDARWSNHWTGTSSVQPAWYWVTSAVYKAISRIQSTAFKDRVNRYASCTTLHPQTLQVRVPRFTNTSVPFRLYLDARICTIQFERRLWKQKWRAKDGLISKRVPISSQKHNFSKGIRHLNFWSCRRRRGCMGSLAGVYIVSLSFPDHPLRLSMNSLECLGICFLVLLLDSCWVCWVPFCSSLDR